MALRMLTEKVTGLVANQYRAALGSRLAETGKEHKDDTPEGGGGPVPPGTRAGGGGPSAVPVDDLVVKSRTRLTDNGIWSTGPMRRDRCGGRRVGRHCEGDAPRRGECSRVPCSAGRRRRWDGAFAIRANRWMRRGGGTLRLDSCLGPFLELELAPVGRLGWSVHPSAVQLRAAQGAMYAALNQDSPLPTISSHLTSPFPPGPPGLRYEDLLNEGERDIAEALTLADGDVLTGRTRRIKRALDLGFKRKSLQDYAPDQDLELFKSDLYGTVEKIRARDQEYALLNAHNK